MALLTLPFAARLDAGTGDVEPRGPITERRVSDLQGLVADEAAWRRAVGLVGRGVLLLYDGREARAVEMGPGVAGYVPPGWAHRTVNVADEPFRFLAVYPGTAGHDYEAVARTGMGARVVRSADGYRVARDQEE